RLASSFVSNFAADRRALIRPVQRMYFTSTVHRTSYLGYLSRPWLGGNHDKVSTHRPSGSLAGGRSHDGHGSKWSAHWWISSSAVEPEFLWPLRLPASSSLLSSLLRLLSCLSCLSHRRGLLGLLPH